MNDYQAFLQKSEINAFNSERYIRIAGQLDKFYENAKKGKEQFSDLELARQRAAHLKKRVIDDLDKYLVEFETNFIRNGGKVIWAPTAETALKEIKNILNKKQINLVLKGKSMITEEIRLNEFLKNENIEAIETDLGEFIQQLNNEAPYHIVTPAMHQSLESIKKLMLEKGLLKESEIKNATAETITYKVRNYLRNKFRVSAAGISGANFLIPDIGGVSVTENEGNVLLSSSGTQVHIVIAGIEKLISSVKHLGLFLPLLASHATGQNMTAYNSIFCGPKQLNEKDGPKEMYVILLDNGRTNILKDSIQREALSCIRCGACHNVCPVFKLIGGHAYPDVYAGPIGSVITPLMKGNDQFGYLSHASSLCGKCTEVCPVHIDIHKLLLQNRNKSTTSIPVSTFEIIAWKLWKSAMLNRSLIEKTGSGLKNFIFRWLFKNSWSKRRTPLKFADKSFNKLYKEK